MRQLLALLLALGILVSAPSPAVAAPSAACAGGLFTTEDMAGAYLSQPNMMALAIGPCGELILTWDNPYGRHQAVYQAVERFPGGGFIAAGVRPEQMFGVYLDNQTAIGVSPAEPGFIKIITLSPYLTDPRQYRLEKIR